MKSVKILLIGLVLVSLCFFGGVTYYSLVRLNHTRPTELVVTGKQVWSQRSCMECHTIFGTGSYLASDLTHSVTRTSPEAIRSFLLESPKDQTIKEKSHLFLEEDEVEAILHLLIYVDQLNVRDLPDDFLDSKNEKSGKDNSGKSRNSMNSKKLNLEGCSMPTIFLHGPKMDKEKKAQLAKIFTESTSEATGIPKESILVYFQETNPESVASGGVLIADKRKS